MLSCTAACVRFAFFNSESYQVTFCTVPSGSPFLTRALLRGRMYIFHIAAAAAAATTTTTTTDDDDAIDHVLSVRISIEYRCRICWCEQQQFLFHTVQSDLDIVFLRQQNPYRFSFSIREFYSSFIMSQK